MKMIDDVIIIGIDSGYGNIKTANCCFPASVSTYAKEPVFKENLLVFESKFYLIGEGHKEFLADKTKDLDYYVLALAAIARELNIRKMTCGKIRIAAGLPLTWVSGQRDEFRDYLLQNKAVDFSFRNVSYHVEIVGVDVFPQGFAAVADRLSDFRGVNMICDIGNGTMNIMFINDKKPVSGNMFTEKYGTHQCLLAVRENVMRAHHTTVDEAIINRVFRFGTADIKEDYLKTITDTATDYVEGIFQRLREHEYNPELMRLYVLGGGSCLIRNFGVYDASRVTINDDICATAKGYEYLAYVNLLKNGGTSFVVLDPKGELLRDTGHLLEENGYEIKVLDLIDMEKSHCYNPFVYISSDDDIQRLTTNLFKNTTPKGSQTQDPFWDQTAAMLLKALVCYLHYEAPPDEQNFSMVMEMIRAGDVKEDNEEYQSVLDELFERLEERHPEHIALKYYRAYHSGSAKTLKSIQISLVSRLEKFNLDSLAGITQCDEMDLGQIGERKTAVFAVIPDNDSSFNFIVGMLYTQLFQQLYYQADSVHGGRLPVHVHFVMDEFANVALPDEFDKLLSTMRSREISVSIIIQNLAQLKALFEKQWESIVGNCDEFLYLGGNEQSTHEYVSKLLGKETIDTNTYGRSRGRNGSYSTNYQLAGRELMTPDEVRMLDNRYALLFIRGERPIRDLKYDILHHPNVALTTDGSAPAYTHGEDTRSIASMAFSFDKKAVKNAEKLEAEKHEFLLYSEEELEELLDEKEKKDNEET